MISVQVWRCYWRSWKDIRYYPSLVGLSFILPWYALLSGWIYWSIYLVTFPDFLIWMSYCASLDRAAYVSLPSIQNSRSCFRSTGLRNCEFQNHLSWELNIQGVNTDFKDHLFRCQAACGAALHPWPETFPDTDVDLGCPFFQLLGTGMNPRLQQ